ncbi:hypothetical protein CcaverHIS002_0401310 [Cutaneotrichosporon cavernicola]|nr:hypothetical protein CcaverHIS002_0401310 [Cutaneotrichosporon cavernicola]
MGPLPLYLAESLDKNPAKKGRAAKVKVKFSKADYAPLAESVECRDVWRKVMFPALVEGREWSAGERGWDGAMKLHLPREVLGTAKPDWEVIAVQFPSRTPTQVSDVWRKVVLPRLMSGKLLN